jgi:hypothetical protein
MWDRYLAALGAAPHLQVAWPRGHTGGQCRQGAGKNVLTLPNIDKRLPALSFSSPF